MSFLHKLDAAIEQNNSLVCVGLDPDLQKIPKKFFNEEDAVLAFNKWIIRETAEYVACYKPQIAFYAGIDGLKSLHHTIEFLKADYPHIPILLDAKRGDIGSTATMYAKEAFDVYGADAVTVNPYLGSDSLTPFLERKDKGVVILCRTSNPGALDFQDLVCEVAKEESKEENLSVEEKIAQLGKEGQKEVKEKKQMPLYLHVVQKVSEWHQHYGNCLLVVGATWPEQMKQIREIAPELTFLVPGIGAQGGDLENTLKNGLRPDKKGLLISSSRGIIYADDPAGEAMKLRDEINSFRGEEPKFAVPVEEKTTEE